MRIKQLILALVLLLGFSTSAFADTEFVKSAIQMGTAYCPEAKFECENLSSQRTEIIAAANKCAETSFAIKESILNDFSTSGEFENCATPSHGYKNSRGTNMYAICCVKKNSENCEMYCTSYVDQK